MGKVNLLDCTLRDGGYVNDWMFGEDTIKGFCQKIGQTGIEFFEVGFLKGDSYNSDKAVFPTVESYIPMITPKYPGLKYVGMVDMSNPVSLDVIPRYDGNSIDGIRVIFKKDKIEEAYDYCKKIKKLGYFLSVNFVSTDAYTDEEFIHGINKFNDILPDAMSIVDTFGLIKRKQFLRMVYIADNNMADDITLAYHAHNNLQQAMGNAEALVELNLKRDVMIDACIFGMGRGAGNLNLELFAEFMNENYDSDYKIEPMLEIMDEYLADIYRDKFWGYSLPLYLSASMKCHPNYAIYLAEKDSLTAKNFQEILSEIDPDDKAKFSKDKAEYYYSNYMAKGFDDAETKKAIHNKLEGRNIVILAPGRTLIDYEGQIKDTIKKQNAVVIAVNFLPTSIDADYIFSNNIKRYRKIKGRINVPCILTSNVEDDNDVAYRLDYKKYVSSNPDVMDNSGLMLLRFLISIGIKEISFAGFDGYSDYYGKDYYSRDLEYSFSSKAENRNKYISDELNSLGKEIKINYITPTKY